MPNQQCQSWEGKRAICHCRTLIGSQSVPQSCWSWRGCPRWWHRAVVDSSPSLRPPAGCSACSSLPAVGCRTTRRVYYQHTQPATCHSHYNGSNTLHHRDQQTNGISMSTKVGTFAIGSPKRSRDTNSSTLTESQSVPQSCWSWHRIHQNHYNGSNTTHHRDQQSIKLRTFATSSPKGSKCFWCTIKPKPLFLCIWTTTRKKWQILGISILVHPDVYIVGHIHITPNLTNTKTFVKKVLD